VIIRTPHPTKNFTIVQNEIVRNPSLSFKARGLLIYLLSMPADWSSSSTNLARMAPDGRESIRTGMRELHDAGFMVTTKRQTESGHWVTETHVYDTPQLSTENPTGNPLPRTEKPTTVNLSLYQELSTKNNKRIGSKVTNKKTENCGQCRGQGWKPTPEGELEKCTHG
jgi:hypothetical protein